MKILYLHGLGSGANSRTVKCLQKAFPDAVIDHPELPIRPKEAVEFLKKHYWDEDVYDIIIGTSLGGFYALALPFLSQLKLLINPAMFADEDIEKGIGLGKQPFFGPRSDGATEYVIDEEFIAELREIREDIYSRKDIMWPQKMNVNDVNCTYALFGDRDELVRHYDDFCRLFLEEHAHRFDGAHRLTEENIQNVAVPLIQEIMDAPQAPICVFFDRFDD